MILKVLKTLDEVKEIQEEWSELLKKSANNSIYLKYEWIIASYEVFHPLDKLRILTVRDDKNVLHCIAPLVITKIKYRWINLDRIGFIKNAQNPENDFICRSAMQERLLEVIMEYLCDFLEWDFIEFNMLEENSLTTRNLKKFLQKKSAYYGTKLNRRSPYFYINCTWDEFWGCKSNRFKKSMRNKLNRVNQRGFVIQKTMITDERVPELADMLNISNKSWKREVGTDLLTKKGDWRFDLALYDRLGKTGIFFLYLLKFEEIPVAYEFHIEHQGVVYPIRADFDEGFKEVSPGSILEYEIIKNLFSGKKGYEYHSCGHNYEYLLNWTDKTRDYVNVEIFNKTFSMSVLFKFEYEALVVLRKMPFYENVKKIVKTLVKV